MIKDLQLDLRWLLGDELGISMYVDGLKDEGLVPGGAQGLVQLLGHLTLVEEGHPGEGVRQAVTVPGQQVPGLVDVCPQLVLVLHCEWGVKTIGNY